MNNYKMILRWTQDDPKVTQMESKFNIFDNFYRYFFKLFVFLGSAAVAVAFKYRDFDLMSAQSGRIVERPSSVRKIQPRLCISNPTPVQPRSQPGLAGSDMRSKSMLFF